MNVDLVSAQTSVPDWLMSYCRQLADVYYQRKLNRMYVHMLQSFLAYEPWKANPPFEWRVVKMHGSARLRPRNGEDMGWVPFNMQMPVKTSEEIKQKIEQINWNLPSSQKRVSIRMFLYTALVWWCTAVYPYEGPRIL